MRVTRAVRARVAQLGGVRHHRATSMISFSPIYDTLSKITGITKGLLDAHIQVKINDVAIELQGAIIDLQSKVAAVQAEYQEALRAKEETEKQLVAYEQWERESARYAMKEMSPGVVAYALKPDCAAGEPTHWICATCYKDRKVSILHPASKGSNVWVCPRVPGHILDLEERC